MTKQDLTEIVRFGIPQAVTATRALLGGWALFAAWFHRPELAAGLITLGAVTDGLDGPLARKFKVASEFGSLFDCYADYLCYVVAPSVLTFLIIQTPASPLAFLALVLPLVSGAIRYSGNLIRQKKETFEQVGVPGLATVFYAFFIVTLAYLRQGGVLSLDATTTLVLILDPMLACVMVLPLRYPKLMKHRWICIPILAGFTVMPFVQSTALAGVALILGFIYAVASPFFIRQRQHEPAAAPGGRPADRFDRGGDRELQTTQEDFAKGKAICR
jgi:CDP-diacylglycerol--serine O-phosphatidyltransferase